MLAFGVVYLELRGVGVRRELSMFIVVVLVVATCTDLTCTVSTGVQAGQPSDLRNRVRA